MPKSKKNFWLWYLGVQNSKSALWAETSPLKRITSLWSPSSKSPYMHHHCVIHLADALSRAHLEEQLTNAEKLDINLVEHMISDLPLARFVEETKEDEIFPQLQKLIMFGRPKSRGQVPARLLGIGKTRDVLFWPGMAADITEKIKKCPVCLENRSSQQSEPLKSHEIPPLALG